jgi:ribosomal protein S18 acetylase RimI-like enzyme
LNLEIKEVTSDYLSEYATIPMTLEVRTILTVEEIEKGLGGLGFREEKVEKSYIKDYDSYEDLYSNEVEGCGPESWPHHFDISNWGFFIAYDGKDPVGAAALAWNTAGVNMLEGRSDIAVLWDIRVQPELRSQGIGAMLFDHAARRARTKGCKLLKIETQNVNVPACRFYAKQGCHLGQINRYGYYGHHQVSNEVMLIWYLDL